MRNVFVNLERCIGCKQCQIVCAVEHSESKFVCQAIAEDHKPLRAFSSPRESVPISRTQTNVGTAILRPA